MMRSSNNLTLKWKYKPFLRAYLYKVDHSFVIRKKAQN